MPSYEPLMKIRTIKNETLGPDLLEEKMKRVTDPHQYCRWWWHDPFPSYKASWKRPGWRSALTSIHELMIGVDVICGLNLLTVSIQLWVYLRDPPMNTTALTFKAWIALHVCTEQTDQENRTGGLPVTQDACLTLPWIPQSSWLLGRVVAISFAS